MAKKILVTVSTCHECTNSKREYFGLGKWGYSCVLESKEIPLHEYPEFPDWCPLEDSEE